MQINTVKDMKEQIEEILLTDYQYVDCYTVQKLLDLFAVSWRNEHIITNEKDAFDRGYTKGWTEGFNSGKVNGD